jgi:hypothetical protein
MSIEGMPSMKGTQQQQQLMASQRSIHENDGHYGPPGGWQDEADTGLIGPATHNISFPMHPDSAQWNSSDRMNRNGPEARAASVGPVGVPGPPGGGEDTAELAGSRKRKHEELADREERGSRSASAGSKVRRGKVTSGRSIWQQCPNFYLRGAQESFPRKPSMTILFLLGS